MPVCVQVEVFKARLDRALSNLVWGKVFLVHGRWVGTRWSLRSLSIPTIL